MDSIDLLSFGFFRALKALFFVLPRRSCLFAGGVFGILIYHLDRKHRRLALANLEKAFGRSCAPTERSRRARASFRHFGRMLADNLKWTHLDAEKRNRLLQVEGEEHIHQALEAGRGTLIFSAHLGNWELASAAISAMGRLDVVARPLDNRRLEQELASFRRLLGANVISKFQAAKPVLQALRQNRMVAILIDQNVMRSEAVFVDFFGLPAATTPGLASFHLRAGSPLIPVFCYPQPDLAYRVKIGRPLDFVPTGDWNEDVLKITQRCTKIIEAEIRDHPGYWLWFHNRWKTRPETGPDRMKPASQDQETPS
jgi:KDO2-lipid IV(A) lauroyltransferase